MAVSRSLLFCLGTVQLCSGVVHGWLSPSEPPASFPSRATVRPQQVHDGDSTPSLVPSVLTARDDVYNGIDWTTLSSTKNNDITAFLFTLSNITDPGENELLYAEPQGYRLSLPWWTGLPGAIVNLLIALRILTNDSWRWRSAHGSNKQPQQQQQMQTHRRPDWSRPADTQREKRAPSAAARHIVDDRGDSDDDDDDERPGYLVAVNATLQGLQLAYLLAQTLAGLAFFALQRDGDGASASLRFVGPAAYCLLLAAVCQAWSALFQVYGPGSRNPKSRPRLHRLLSFAYAPLAGLAAVLALVVFCLLTAPPVGQAPAWRVWSPWCVPYGYIGPATGDGGGGGGNGKNASGWSAAEFVFKAPAGTGTPAYPTGPHRWPCADSTGLALHTDNVSFFPRLGLDVFFAAAVGVLLLAAPARLVQLRRVYHRARTTTRPLERLSHVLPKLLAMLFLLVTCLFAALKFYDLAQLGSALYFHGSYLVCPGLVNTTTGPFNVSGIGMCFGVQVELPAVSPNIQTALAMDGTNVAQLIFNV